MSLSGRPMLLILLFFCFQQFHLILETWPYTKWHHRPSKSHGTSRKGRTDRISFIESITRHSIRLIWLCRRTILRMECEVKLEFITTRWRNCVSSVVNLNPSQAINQTLIVHAGPFTEYKIVVVAITTRHDGNASAPLLQRTDIAAPSPPTITNLACQKDGTILLRWKRPLVFYNTIDFYIVSYKSSKMDFYRQFQINASSDHIETEVCIENK